MPAKKMLLPLSGEPLSERRRTSFECAASRADRMPACPRPSRFSIMRTARGQSSTSNCSAQRIACSIEMCTGHCESALSIRSELARIDAGRPVITAVIVACPLVLVDLLAAHEPLSDRKLRAILRTGGSLGGPAVAERDTAPAPPPGPPPPRASANTAASALRWPAFQSTPGPFGSVTPQELIRPQREPPAFDRGRIRRLLAPRGHRQEAHIDHQLDGPDRVLPAIVRPGRRWIAVEADRPEPQGVVRVGIRRRLVDDRHDPHASLDERTASARADPAPHSPVR